MTDTPHGPARGRFHDQLVVLGHDQGRFVYPYPDVDDWPCILTLQQAFGAARCAALQCPGRAELILGVRENGRRGIRFRLQGFCLDHAARALRRYEWGEPPAPERAAQAMNAALAAVEPLLAEPLWVTGAEGCSPRLSRERYEQAAAQAGVSACAEAFCRAMLPAAVWQSTTPAEVVSRLLALHYGESLRRSEAAHHQGDAEAAWAYWRYLCCQHRLAPPPPGTRP